MIKCKKFISGFTLIELLLAMGILAFLAAAGVMVIGNFSREQNLDVAADDVQNALAQAKSYALSQVVRKCNVTLEPSEISAGITTEDVLRGYEVQFDTSVSPNKYSIYEVCQLLGSGDPVALSPAINTYYLPSDISFEDPAQQPIRFKVLTGGSEAGGDVTVKTTDNKTKTITVSTTGKIVKHD